jgi:hypothetical protein
VVLATTLKLSRRRAQPNVIFPSFRDAEGVIPLGRAQGRGVKACEDGHSCRSARELLLGLLRSEGRDRIDWSRWPCRDRDAGVNDRATKCFYITAVARSGHPVRHLRKPVSSKIHASSGQGPRFATAPLALLGQKRSSDHAEPAAPSSNLRSRNNATHQGSGVIPPRNKTGQPDIEARESLH